MSRDKEAEGGGSHQGLLKDDGLDRKPKRGKNSAKNSCMSKSVWGEGLVPANI